MDSLDAYVFLTKSSKNLLVVMYEATDQLTFQSFETFSSNIVGDPPAEPSAKADASPILREDPRNCILVSCNSLLDVTGLRNHWIPCFFKERLSHEDFVDLTTGTKGEAKMQLIKSKQAYDDLKASVEHSSDALEISLINSQISEVERDIELFLGLRFPF